MNYRIELLIEKKLVGKRIIMSLSNNKTGELWKSFMQRQKEIGNNIGSELYSIQRYEDSYFKNFNPNTSFEKWAAKEVLNFDMVPEKMETIVLPAGLYVVFIYKGLSTDHTIFEYIFNEWLPKSPYNLDNRLHFEVLGEKYKNDSTDSEEEI
jgi:AraC family transcriptional regulator